MLFGGAIIHCALVPAWYSSMLKSRQCFIVPVTLALNNGSSGVTLLLVTRNLLTSPVTWLLFVML